MIEGLVSTIIPVYNRPGMLREAASSVLAQTYRPVEILIVDDESTDDTPQACASLAATHPEIRYTRVPNGGPGLAREAGRLLARGEFIQYLDSDDILQPRKFELQVAALRTHPSRGIAYCRTSEYHVSEGPSNRAGARTGEVLDQLFPALLSGRIWQTVTPLFRAAVTDALGPWSSLIQEEDWEYDARAAALGTHLVWCPEFLADHRHHDAARAGGGSYSDVGRMRSRYRAHCLILEHAHRAGVLKSDPNMQRYARELFLLARQCGRSGLSTESAHLFTLAREASSSGQPRLDYWSYGLLARLLGWSAAGRLACWLDQQRKRAG